MSSDKELEQFHRETMDPRWVEAAQRIEAGPDVGQIEPHQEGAEIIQLELLLKKLIRAAEASLKAATRTDDTTYLEDVIATAKAHLGDA